jgi:hypothetical protein
MIRKIALIGVGVALALAWNDTNFTRRVKCALSDQNCSNIVLEHGCEHVNEVDFHDAHGPTLIRRDEFESFGFPSRSYSYDYFVADKNNVVIGSGEIQRESTREAGEVTIGLREGRCQIVHFYIRSLAW